MPNIGDRIRLIRLFVGPDEDHLALAGTLTFRLDEADEFTELWESGRFWRVSEMVPADTPIFDSMKAL